MPSVRFVKNVTQNGLFIWWALCYRKAARTAPKGSELTEAKDDAFSRLPETGVDYEIEQVEDDPFPDT